MKYMIVSDIHGSFTFAEQAVERFEAINADYLILLGDILYHGPRNPLPEGHNPQAAADLLNRYADRIIAVRGNCDAEVDQMLLHFPCMGDYCVIADEGRRLFATHGHIFHEGNLPPLPEGSIFLSGHTHVWRAEQAQTKDGKGIFFCNPGSVSLPKSGVQPEGRLSEGENPRHTYAVYTPGEIVIQDLNAEDPECNIFRLHIPEAPRCKG